MSLWQTPAIVMAFLTWLLSPPTSFADAARREALRREALPRATRVLTSEDVSRMPRRPSPTPPIASAGTSAATPAPAAPDATKKDLETHDEVWWHARITAARDAFERDQLLVESLQSRVNALTNEWSARDDPAQRQQLWDQRARALGELEHMKEQIVTIRRPLTRSRRTRAGRMSRQDG